MFIHMCICACMCVCLHPYVHDTYLYMLIHVGVVYVSMHVPVNAGDQASSSSL